MTARANAARTTVGVALVLALTACWSQPVAIDTESVAVQKPRPPDRKPPTTATSPSEPAAAGQTSEPLPQDFALTAPDFTLPEWTRAPLGGGATAVVHAAAPGPTAAAALLRVTLPIGTAAAAPGLAALTFHVLTDVPAGARGEASLHDRIAGMGGDLTLQLGSRATVLELVVPPDRWSDALATLAESLVDPGATNDAIDREREALVADERVRLRRSDLPALVERVTVAEGVTPDVRVTGLEDCTAAQVTLFRGVAMQPAGAVLTAWIPGNDADGIVTSARASLQPWTGGEDATEPKPAPAKPPLLPRVFWAPNDDVTSQVALVMPIPSLDEPFALEKRLLVEVLTVSGVAGRLGAATAALLGNEAALRSREVWNGSTRYLLLHGVTPAHAVPQLWDALRRARASLVRDPPSSIEVRQAAERLRLHLLADVADPWHWADELGPATLRGPDPVDLQAALAALDHPEKLPLKDATESLLQDPVAMLVLGGAPPTEGTMPVAVVAPLALEPEEAALPAEVAAQVEAAAPFVEQALRVAGGVENLAAFRGYHGIATRSASDGAACDDEVWFSSPDRLHRLRKVLATRIETTIGKGKATERAGSETVALDAEEAQRLLRAQQRHPLLLLAALARGTASYRLVSRRTVGDRRMAVLERVGRDPDRIRIVLDEESGLIRQVEALEYRPELKSRVRIVDSWSDYRSIGPVRAPFYRETNVDGSDRSVVTTWTMIEAGVPSERELGLLDER